MRLQWKYTLIITLSVLTILVAFYVIVDIKAKNDLKQLHVQNVERGAIFRDIAEKIRRRIEEEIELWQEFHPDEIEKALYELNEQLPEMRNVLDINVTLGLNAKILASLTQELLFSINLTSLSDLGNESSMLYILRRRFEDNGISLSDEAGMRQRDNMWLIKDDKRTYAVKKEENKLKVYGHSYINFTEYNLFELERKGVQVYNIVELENHKYATEVIIRYQAGLIDQTDWDAGEMTGTADSGNVIGVIQVFFDAPDITRYINDLRFMHLIFVIVASVLLIIIIGITTTRLIMRPLEHMMEIIKHAEVGDLESLPRTYSSGEIGRVTYSLVRMLRQLSAAHSKRIAALGHFAAGAAHEIRNPLNSIGMTAQHLKELFAQKEVKLDDIEEARELLDIVNYEIEQLKQISEQFLTLNRPKKLNLEPTHLNALLDRILAEFTLTMENAEVQVIKNYDKNLPLLKLDETLIRQTIFNFVQNSIQAMPKGGSIYITTMLEETIAGKGLALEIRDTGIGIPEEIQERIFDAYFTTKEKEGGMGLGLAISHQIIMAHRGEVELKSQVGMGTVFKISFPLVIHDVADDA